MALSCGCEFRAGEPVKYNVIRAHYKHTMEAILFWELLTREGIDLSDARSKLNLARIDLMEAIDKMFPEARGEP